MFFLYLVEPVEPVERLLAGVRVYRFGHKIRGDEGARERLLFYGRQDVGHALLNTITLLEKVDALNRAVRSLQWLVSALTLGISMLLLLFLLR